MAAAPALSGTGSSVDEGRTFTPLDNILTVTDTSGFKVGQILVIDTEQMRVTSISFRDLGVVRGVNGTPPKAHADRSKILAIGDELTIYIGTIQGSVKKLRDDGSGLPNVEWTFSPLDAE